MNQLAHFKVSRVPGHFALTVELGKLSPTVVFI